MPEDASLFAAVDGYLTQTLIAPDPALESALQSHVAAGLPPINVTPTLGKFLHLQARAIRAERILEIGTLGGYSTIWMARALPPSGRVVTLEYDPKHAEVARKNFQRADLATQIEVIVGAALDTLPKLAAQNPAPFDLIFIDADKKSNPHYFQWALKLARPGSLIIVDNVVRDGAVINANSDDPDIRGIRQFLTELASNPRVCATALQTIDGKGHDGFSIALVL